MTSLGANPLLSLSKEQLKILAAEHPALYAKVKGQLKFEHLRREQEICEGSLLEFIKRAWKDVDPAELNLNWHHVEICEQLEAVVRGEVRQLVINIPPRHTKTLIVNVFFPAWVWCRQKTSPLSGPQVKFLSVSYGATLSQEIALKRRRLIMGPWYQSHWGDRVKLRDDQKSREIYANTEGGEHTSCSIEGGLLGRGGDIQIIDDPQTRKGVDSEIERAASIRGMSDLMTRITDPRIAARILIMQRLHLADATNWALENWPKPIVWLMFPARFETGRACEYDHRQVDGELLWQAVWSDEELAKIERGLSALDGEMLSDYAVSGQLQQYPIPRGGGIVSQDDWKIYPEQTPRLDDLQYAKDGTAFVPLPAVTRVIVCLDTAISEKDTADWNACIVWGVWSRPEHMIVGRERVCDEDGEQPRAIMMGGWRIRGRLNDETLDHVGMPKGLVQRLAYTANRFQAATVVIENKTRGIDVKNEIERQLGGQYSFQIELFEPRKHGDKAARLHAVQPLFSQGLVYAPAVCKLIQNDAEGYPLAQPFVSVTEYQWVRDVMKEVEAVPRGIHDDYADCCFAPGTMIATRRGSVPIAEVQVGDEVVTPLGWCRVNHCGPTRTAAVVDRLGLIGTAHHPVFSVEAGYRDLDSFGVGLTASRLSLCDLIRLTLRSTSSTRAQPIASWGGHGNTTSRNRPPTLAGSNRRVCMSRNGSMKMIGRFLLITKSTTAITTRLISILITWSAYRRTCIAGSLSTSIQRRSALLSRWLGRARQSGMGIDPRTAGRGIGGMLRRAFASPEWRRLTARPRCWTSSAPRAVGLSNRNGSWPGFAACPAGALARSISVVGESCPTRIMPPQTAYRSILNASPAASDSPPRVERPGSAASAAGVVVYNLEVEEAECYYANGILVHNCSMGLITLREGGYLDLTDEHIRNRMAYRRPPRRGPNKVIEHYGV